jgi:hypothetical protein
MRTRGIRMALFAWDEIDRKLRIRSPISLFRCNAEGGWTTEGWVEGLELHEAVEIRTQGRHYALETWARTRQEAHARFMLFPTYAEYYEGD